MRWKTAVSCTIFGTSYGAGAKVDVTSWTNEQLNYQIYMGHIVEDKDVPLRVQNTEVSVGWTGAHTDLALSGMPRGTFVGPPSGRGLHIQTTQAHSRSSTVALIWHRVQAGSSVGNGAVIYDSQPSRWNQLASGESNTRVSIVGALVGLTPGATYNYTTRTETAYGGGYISYCQFLLVPQPD